MVKSRHKTILQSGSSQCRVRPSRRRCGQDTATPQETNGKFGFVGWPAPPFPVALGCGDNCEEGSGAIAIAVLEIDLGKNSCRVAGLDELGRIVLRRRLTRDGVVRLSARLPACVVAMAACCGAHHLGRVLSQQGHQVRLKSPEYVRPYVKAQKNDERDPRRSPRPRPAPPCASSS